MASWLDEAQPVASAAAPPQPATHWLQEAQPAVDHSKGHFAEEWADFQDWLAPRVRAALNGATFRHAADLAGLLDPEHAADYKREYHNASQEHQGLELLGGLAAPLPGVGPLKAMKGVGGVLARTAARTGIGAGAGLATGDTGLSAPARAGIGALAGLGGSALTEGLEALGTKAADKVREAVADEAAARTKVAQKAQRSATSAVGGETSAALNTWRQAQEIAQGGPGYTAEQVAKAKAILADPEWQAVVQHAADNVLGVGADRLKGSLQTAQNVLATARARAAPEAIEAATDEALSNPLKTQVLPRLKKYATRMIPLAVGAHVGGVPGAVIGGIVGTALGDPGTAASNMMKSPAFRAGAWRAVQSVAPKLATGIDSDVAGLVEGAEPLAPMLPAWAGDDGEQRKQAMIAALRKGGR